MSSALDQFERQLVAASRELSRPNPASAPMTPQNGRGPVDGRRPRRRLRQKRLLVSLAALVVLGGGVAAASSVLWPSQRLAEGTVNCFMATHGTGALNGHLLAIADGKPNGQPPLSFCRMWYRLNDYRLNGSRTGPNVASLPLIACQETATMVGVYVATGKPNQCRSLGERPLPKTYADADAKLRNLQHALLAIQDKRDCASVTSIAQQTRAVLSNQGFTHWRVITPPPDPGKHWLYGYALPAGTGGTCGTLLMGVFSSPTVDMDTQRETVTVSVGPPRTIGLAVNRIMPQVAEATQRRCYTRISIRPLAQHAFASTPLRPRFATVAGQPGVGYGPPSTQRLYDEGCVFAVLAVPGNNSRFIDILLNARDAPRLPAGEVYPPASSFQP